MIIFLSTLLCSSQAFVHPSHTTFKPTSTFKSQIISSKQFPPSSIHSNYQNAIFSTKTTTTNANFDFTVETMECDETSIMNAAQFMVDAFWLQPNQILDHDDDDESEIPNNNNNISDGARANVEELQRVDLQEKYGERMGKRILNSCILSAKGSYNDGADDDDGESKMLGMVCIEVGLIDKFEKTILKTQQSESKLTNAVASLKPSQRRQYKNASVSQIATQLLPPEIQLTVLLSNLAVSPQARKRGIGTQLCLEAERIVKEEWGLDNISLKVEAKNEGARRIYEGNTLEYQLFHSDPACSALRVNLEDGSLVEVEVETLTLMKTLS